MAQDIVRRLELYHRAYRLHVLSGLPLFKFSYDWGPDRQWVSQSMLTEHDSLLRGFLGLGYIRFGGTEADSLFARRVLKEIPPASPLWSWREAYLDVLSFAGGAHRHLKFADAVIDRHPDPDIRIATLIELCMAPEGKWRDPDLRRQYLERLRVDFPNDPSTRGMSASYERRLAVTMGVDAPQFEVRDIEDSTRVYTNASFLGKPLLIHVWSTLLPSAATEAKNLNNILHKFAPRGPEILSLAYDEKSSDVMAFRREIAPMQWHHAILDGAWGRYQLAQFADERFLLIGKDGKIAATDYRRELEGDELLKTIAKVLSVQKVGKR
jgi:hypothetical protein